MSTSDPIDSNQKPIEDGASALSKNIEVAGLLSVNLLQVMKGVSSVVGKIPLGPLSTLLKGFINIGTNVANKFLEIDAIASKMTQTFGTGKANIQQTKETLYDAGAEMLTFSKSFKTINEAMEGANKLASDYSALLNRSILLSKESIVELQLVIEATGVGSEKLIPGFVNAGFQISRVKEEMEGVMNYAIGMGVNVNAVSSRVADNLKQFDKYNFQNGIQGLTKMATQAAKLGVDMKDIFTVADKLMDPDEAIKMSSALQRLGVTSSALLDPLKLMDMAQNSPEELQNEIAKMATQYSKLNEKTGQFEIINKREFKAIAEASNMSVESLSLISKKGLEAKTILSQLSIPTFNMSEEDQSLVTSLAQFDKGTGEYKIKVGQGDQAKEKSVGLLTPEDFDELRKSVKPEKIEDVAKDQLSINQSLNRAIETLNQTQLEGIVTNRELNKTMQQFTTGAKTFAKAQVGSDVDANKKGEGLRTANTPEKITKGLEKKGSGLIDSVKEVFNQPIPPTSQPAQDFIFRPGQDPLRFSEGDLVMGIDEESLSNAIKSKKTSNYKEESFNNYKIPSESNDKSLDRFNEVKNQSQTITNIQQASGEITLNVVIKAEVPSGMDKEKFNTLITDTGVMQNIKREIEKVTSNFSLTPKK